MVQFGRRIENERRPSWSGFYVQYSSLKYLLKQVKSALDQNNMDEASAATVVFTQRLDHEISKAAVFYEETIKEISSKVSSLQKTWEFVTPATHHTIYVQYKSVVRQLTEGMRFVELNTEAVRKILKKAEKVSEGRAVETQAYIIDRLRPDNENKLQALRVYPGTDQLVAELHRRLLTLKQMEASWSSAAPFNYGRRSRSDTKDLLNDLRRVTIKTVTVTRWYYGLLAQAQIDYERDPVGESTNWGLFLNNYNTFLYLANYYIVIPTAYDYAMAVDLPDTSSGVLLAMAPLASCLSSILYSYWSNWSFKQPLVFCTFVVILGNVLYVSALPCHSAALLFIGRLLVGFGGNRAVNRRYIADFISAEDRTFHSVLFVAVGSLGMSFGPGAQPILTHINTTVPWLGWPVNWLTSPGWLMIGLWVIFGIMVVIFFSEPERRYVASDDNILNEPFTNQETPATPPQTDMLGTGACLWIYFVLKLVQESFQTAAPLIAWQYFGWKDSAVGTLLAVVGVVVFPTNMLVGLAGRYIRDRHAQDFGIICLATGAVLAYMPFMVYRRFQYVLGFLLIFVAAQVVEGVNMSILSKVMPKTMSKGLLNSGFLSTEAGTFGRVIGASLISLQSPRALVVVVTLVSIMLLCSSLVASSVLDENEKKADDGEADKLLKSIVWNSIPSMHESIMCNPDHAGVPAEWAFDTCASQSWQHQSRQSCRDIPRVDLEQGL